MAKGFIKVFSRKAAGFHRLANVLFELNFFLSKKKIFENDQTRQTMLFSLPVTSHHAWSLVVPLSWQMYIMAPIKLLGKPHWFYWNSVGNKDKNDDTLTCEFIVDYVVLIPCIFTSCYQGPKKRKTKYSQNPPVEQHVGWVMVSKEYPPPRRYVQLFAT